MDLCVPITFYKSNLIFFKRKKLKQIYQNIFKRINNQWIDIN